MTNLFVGGFSPESAAEDVQKLFSRYGTVRSLSFMRGAPNRSSPGSGLVDMAQREARAAITELHGKPFKGGLLQVREACDVDQVQHTGAATEKARRVPPREPVKRLAAHYLLASVESASAPHGGDGEEWYRYTLVDGRSQIVGVHRGTYAEVTAYATDCAEAFNTRSTTGKNTLAWTPYRKR